MSTVLGGNRFRVIIRSSMSQHVKSSDRCHRSTRGALVSLCVYAWRQTIKCRQGLEYMISPAVRPCSFFFLPKQFVGVEVDSRRFSTRESDRTGHALHQLHAWAAHKKSYKATARSYLAPGVGIIYPHVPNNALHAWHGA